MNPLRRRTLLGLLAAGVLGPAVGATVRGYADRGDVQAFVDEMVSRHGFVRGELETLFGRVRYQPAIIQAITPRPAGQRSWRRYRARFVNETRIGGGVEFWAAYSTWLARAAGEFGVPEEIVVAIIGVETLYGRHTGGYRVVDALTTLAFDYPRRAEYFRSELEAFLLHAREADLDVFGALGSYAGAMGIPQFMPSSYRRYAVDFDRDGRRDLFASAADAIGSVANFLREHGWQPGEPIALPARTDGDGWRVLAEGGVEPNVPLSRLASQGIAIDRALSDETPSVVIELESPNAPSSVWVGFRNFYVLTRYNRSSFYATAVLELANEVRAAVPPQGPAASASVR